MAPRCEREGRRCSGEFGEIGGGEVDEFGAAVWAVLASMGDGPVPRRRKRSLILFPPGISERIVVSKRHLNLILVRWLRMNDRATC